MNNSYKKYKNSNLWKVVYKSLKDLENNQDIKFTTSFDLIVGYIVKQIIETKNIDK